MFEYTSRDANLLQFIIAVNHVKVTRVTSIFTEFSHRQQLSAGDAPPIVQG